MNKIVKAILGLLTIPTSLTPFVMASCGESKCTVTFYLNNGSETIYETVEVVKGTTVSKPTNPQQAHKAFKGWYTTEACTTAFNFNTKINSNTSLYAKWVDTYDVTFYKNDGTGEVYKTSTVEKDSTVSKPTDPTRSSYIFDGWYSDAEGNTPFDFSQKITSNTPVYAKWDGPYVQYNVTFYLNNGTESVYKQEQVIQGTTVSQPYQPTRTDYVFNGWFKEKECSTLFDFTQAINADTPLYASWTSLGEKQTYIDNLNLDKNVISDNGYLAEATYTLYPMISTSSSDPVQYEDWAGCCSSFYKNGFCGRNFEWKYGTKPETIIHTTANPNIGRYATVGVAYCNAFSTPDYLGNVSYYSNHLNLPWYTVDGMNEKGLFVSINEVPNDSTSIFSNKGESATCTKNKLNELQLVRYLLDYCSSVEDCQEKIKNYNIVGISGLNEEHIMVADKDGNCAEIEFVPNNTSDLHYKTPQFFTKDNSYFRDIITNFTMNGYEGDCDENWYASDTSLGPRAEGCERYNILYNKLNDPETEVEKFQDVLDIMSNVYYTKSYTGLSEATLDTFWFSEFNYGSNSKTTAHTLSNYQSIVSGWGFDQDAWDAKTVNRESAKFYCTLNSCAYDLKNLQLKLVFEEKYPVDKVFTIAR